MTDLPIVRPSHPQLRDFGAHFDAALECGIVTNNGPWVQKFEAALTEYLKTPTILFSSGMAALTAMLIAAGVGGREVILPSLTFCATPNAVKLAGATPVFADIGPDLVLDPDHVSSLINENTAAILGVDVFGIPCDYDALDAVAASRGVASLYDSAPAFGSSYKRARAGKFGHGQIFSFHVTKPMSSIEGGCLSSNDDSLIQEAKSLRNFGMRDGVCFSAGFNGKMNELCAIIGLRNLETWPDRLERRKLSALALRKSLDEIEGVTVIHEASDRLASWCYQPILVENEFGASRDDVVVGLKRSGIMTRTYYPACHLEPFYCYDKHPPLPATEKVASQIISLPVYDEMSHHEIHRISSAVMTIRKG